MPLADGVHTATTLIPILAEILYSTVWLVTSYLFQSHVLTS
jgi:hypothetical protein